MTRTFSLPEEAATYLDSLRAELADLSPEERDDLLADVEASLVETAAEPGPIDAHLGSPRQFAQELRAAAGIGEDRAAPAEPRLVAAMRRAAAHPLMEPARRVLDRLAPIWWGLRGYVLAAGIALALGTAFSTSQPEIPRFGSSGLGVLVVAALVAGSIWIGLSTNASRLVAAANVVLALAAIPVAVKLAQRHAEPFQQPVVVETTPTFGLAYNGTPIRNLYPYGRDGRLLHDVLLYDENGGPVEIGGAAVPDPDRRVLLTPNGQPIYNSYPIRYFEPGTRTVAHPDVAPPLQLPRIVTPPLTRPPSSRRAHP